MQKTSQVDVITGEESLRMDFPKLFDISYSTIRKKKTFPMVH